ncbi:transglutaminase-like domain-containing protein [Adlercreutzia sp. ZJ141]|uniref:transglutaminase-like domain-containing protein n=1 Tax=Adlercreutzia sp. ZJ141 TaxID=2709406 RepID=UPI0019812080|nr:transglutaminase-like domain-containing protein [Adlercreutzia sp. ZJ141]
MGIASRFNESHRSAHASAPAHARAASQGNVAAGRSAATSPRRVRGFETVAAMLLAAGMALAVLVAPWPVAIVACGAVAAALSTALLAATRYSSRASYGIALGLVMAALAAMLVVGVAPLRATAANVTNTFIDAWNAQFDGYVLHFAVSAPSDGAALMFALFTGLVVGLVVHAICLSRSMIAARLIPITFIVCGLFFQTILPASFACLLLGGALLGSCYARRDDASLRAVPAFAVTLAVIVGVSLLACAGYEGNTQLRDAKGNALATVDEFRFGSDTLPQGDLASAHRMSAVPEEGETDRLRVTFADEEAASNAAPLYLRGFAGVEYTGDAFNRMKPDQYEGEWTGLFTWLDAEGFNTLSQYSAYRSLDDEETGNATETLSVTVDAPGAYRRYAYAPAAATSDGAESLLDLYRTNGEVRGNESSTFEVVAGAPMAETMVPGDWVYEQAASLGSETGPDAGVAADQGDANGEDLSARERNFLRSELAYRSFVYDRYLDVPSDTATVIERFFFEDDTWNADKSTLYSTVTRIRTLLDVSCDYNAQGVRFEGASSSGGALGAGGGSASADVTDSTDATNATNATSTGTASNDYVAWFLEDACEGNSAAFASAAVLAFRQVGVPARYVEGYLLDEETIEHMREAGESSCTLNESNAHAWVEVYVDGAGWMPVEVTPGFYDRVYASDEVVEIAREVAGGASDDSNVGTVAETPDWTDILPEELRPFAWLGLALLFMLMAFIIMGAAELQRLARLGWRSRRLRRAVACGTGSVLLYGRLHDLISDAGVHVDELDPHSCVGALAKAHPEVHAFECDRALSLMERERYGQIPLGEFEVSIVESLLEKLEAGNWERASVSRRIAYRYIGLYLIPLHLVTA